MLANFFEKYPAARRWEEKLQSLLNECGGFTANFITKFKTTKAKELGGIVKGVKKPDADNFFEKAFSVKRPTLPNFSNQQTEQQFFYADDCAWNIIKAFVPDKDKKTIKKNLEWFQQDWCNPKSKYYGWEDGREAPKGNPNKTPVADRTNHEAITACCNILKKHTTDSVIDEMKRTLLQRYPDVTN